uniref:Uncharacterized protein n=1 Tax=Oryza rufipogon TaxID=4529 RepID=A0A0E0PWW0_ORYRU
MATNDDDDVGAAAARPAAAAHQDLICRLLEEGRAPPRRAAEEVDRRVLARSSGRINGISDDTPTIRVAAWMITAIRWTLNIIGLALLIFYTAIQFPWSGTILDLTLFVADVIFCLAIPAGGYMITSECEPIEGIGIW